METLKSCEVLDLERGQWSACAPLQIARSGSRVVALQGDRYLAAAGGCDDVFGRAETQPTVELFDVAAGAWSLLESQLVNPRTTAAVAPVGRHSLLVFGGAPSLTSAEVYRVRLPSEAAAPPREEEFEEAEGGEREPPALRRALAPGVVGDMKDGRMGCQAALLRLPGRGGRFPLRDTLCAVVVGGERCEDSGEGPRVRQFATTSVYDVAARAWREDEAVPPLSAPRTAAALCVGPGRGCSLLEPASP